MIQQIFQTILVSLEVLLIFNLIIIVHEVGHFLAARWRGLVVERFGIWFGKPLWKKKIGGVEYSLGSIPAGGFVALPQLAPMEAIEGKSDVDRASLPQASPLDKIIVAAAGPLFSLLLAALFALAVWILGRPVSEAEATRTVGHVEPGGPAELAGLRPGDEILEVDGHPVERFGGLVGGIRWNIIRSTGETVAFKIRRGDQTLTLHSGLARERRSGLGRKPLRQVKIAPAETPVIEEIAPDSAAARAGLRPGDRILQIDGQPVYGISQIARHLATGGGAPILLSVRGADGQPRDARLQPEPAPAKIARTFPNGPAQVAGLKPGDEIVAIDGNKIFHPLAVNLRIRETAGAPVALSIRRAGAQPFDVRIAPRPERGQSDPRLGIEFGPGTPPLGIVYRAGGITRLSYPRPLAQIHESAMTIVTTFGALFSPKSGVGVEHLSGPVGIMGIYYTLFQSEHGWRAALWFSVILNVNLAILNLLPIPVLDGGHILLAIVEKFRRRPVSLRLLELVNTACALLLIGLMLYLTFFDTLDLPIFQKSAETMRFDPPPAP